MMRSSSWALVSWDRSFFDSGSREVTFLDISRKVQASPIFRLRWTMEAAVSTESPSMRSKL